MSVPFLNIKEQFAEIYPDFQKRMAILFDECKFILGPYVREFEEKFEKMMGSAGTALGVASGTDALILALKALGIQKGDEVIVPAYTFIATADAVIHVGATPVFADIMRDFPNIDIKSIESKITKNTKAIIPVHLYGEAADMQAISGLAQKHNLLIVEDVAQAAGLKINGKCVGSFGQLGAFSFYPTKNLACAGDGGLIFVNSPEFVEKIKLFRDHGRLVGYAHDIIGYNSRLDAVQALILSANIDKLEARNAARQKLAARYFDLLKDADLKLPKPMIKDAHVYNLFTLRSKKRDEIVNALKAKNIGVGIYYPIPLHLQPCLKYLGYKEGDFPNSEQWSKEAFSIPLFPGLTEAQQNEVVETLISIA